MPILPDNGRRDREEPVDPELRANWSSTISYGSGQYSPDGEVRSKWIVRRVNRRSLLILLGVVASIGVLYFPTQYLMEGGLRRSALAQARRLLDEGRGDQALIHLDSYLEAWPDDIQGLELRGELSANLGGSPEQTLLGIRSLDSLLRLDPGSPARQEDRKRLVQLSIRLGDMVRAGSERAKVVADKFEVRYRYAYKIAEQRIKLGADDGESHRLLATTMERLADSGDVELGVEAIKEYQKALRKDPGDFASAERLANLRVERKKDQAGGDQIVDNLARARPRSVEARLVRARYFLKTGREDRAKLDVEAASKLSPADKGVRMMAASLALRRNDPAAARRHLAAIPEGDRGDSRLDVLLAQLEFAERRPEKAVEKLRSGLLRTSGTDRELTWRLAYTLVQLDRSAEARPLMAQFRRLTGRQDHPMLRFLEGSLKERVGRHASAILELESAREEIDGEWRGELDMALGRCHEAVNDLDAAESDFRHARDLSPASPGPRQALARVLLRTTPELAVPELEAGLALVPGSAPMLADLAMAHLARQLAMPADLRDWSAAEAALDRGLRAKPGDPALILARAKLLGSSGRVDQATSVLEEATRGVGRAQEGIWMARARWIEARGRLDEAIKVLEQGSRPDAAGDKAALRINRALLQARSGHGRAALGLLALDVEKFNVADRTTLAAQKANLLLSLGDRPGARAALVEWATLAPEDLGPGLKLVQMAREGGTPEDLDQGVEWLRKVGGEDEPDALAAQALGILLPGSADATIDDARLEQAESIGARLQEIAPKLSITLLVRALLLERGSGFEEAINDYKAALKGDATGLALPRLVALLARLKRVDDLSVLKGNTPSPATIDRITVREALGSGDKEQAEALLARLVEAQPDSLEYRADLARVLRDLGQPEKAEATLRTLVDRRPELPQPWLALLSVQLERGDRVAASATIDRLRGAYKGDRPDLLLIRSLWAIGDREGAAKAAEKSVGARPDDLESIRMASEVEESLGRSDRAEALIVRARKIDPNLAWARRRMALILSGRLNHGRWAEARALTEPVSSSVDLPEDRLYRAIVLERGPDPSHRAGAIEILRSLAEDLPASDPLGRKARLQLAQLLLKANDPAGAVRATVPLTAEPGPVDPMMLAVAIEALARDGKPEPARPLLDRLAKAQPDAPTTQACRALVLKAEGDPVAATAVLVEAAAAAEQAPDGERLARYYFEHLAQMGPDADAESMGRKIAARWPSQSVALARFLASRGRMAEALDACQAASEAGPARELIPLLQGIEVSGRLDEAGAERARKLAIAAAARNPRDAESLAQTAAILRRTRRFEDEVTLYRKILAAVPANVVARNNLAWVLAQDLGRPAEGLVEVDRVIRQVGPSSQALDTRGMILARLGRLDEAIADLERSAKVDPSPVHHIHLARAYAQAGRPDDRRRSLDAARLASANPNALEPEDRAELEAVAR